MGNKVIIIGNSLHNTLGAVRSFGEAKIPQTLLLVCEHDACHVRRSKYLKHGNCFMVKTLDECTPLLESLKLQKGQTLVTTFDAAAEWVDAREPELSKWFTTPGRGKRIGSLFDKDIQCRLARECGLDVPLYVVYDRSEEIPIAKLRFPLLTKPLVSSAGEKEDIHVCQNLEELRTALGEDSRCEKFLLQQFIEKEYEINAIGVSTDDDVVLGGAIHKYRQWPRLVGGSAFGVFEKMDAYDLDVASVKTFLKHSGYHGPFSVEFLHTKDGKNYFMEVNFRNDYLAYAPTCAGVNLHALYVDPSRKIDWRKFRKTYLMNYSLDYLYVKEGYMTRWQWFKDFLRTRCFINICFSDLGPALAYYKQKLFGK
ncbi:MAG: hypothetical protein Q4E55_02500 [Bacteroidales bacterium]|nr:hypothetical protein [Bacteroidales bacterium]